MTTTAIPKSVSDFMQHITDLCGTEHAAWAENFNACFADTLTTTVKRHDDGTTFLLTGDIPAMWLRDSTAQLRPYLALAAEDGDIASLIAGLVRQQFRYITIDRMRTPLTRSRTALPGTRMISPTSPVPGFGSASTRWTRCATPFSWLGCCMRTPATPIISMTNSLPASRRFLTSSRPNSITRTPRISSSATRTFPPNR